MNISEKVAYIKGLVEGLGIDDDKNGKVLKAIIDVLEDMAYEISDLNDFTEELNDGLDEISDDLADVEDVIFGDEDECDCCDDDDCGCGCCDDDDECEFEVTCPSCGENIVLFESDLDLDSIECPNCGETLEFVFDEEDEEEGDEE